MAQFKYTILFLFLAICLCIAIGTLSAGLGLMMFLICMPISMVLGVYCADSDKKEKAEEKRIFLERKKSVIEKIKKHPEAAKYLFETNWGIKKSVITEQDITDDKVDKLYLHDDSWFCKRESIIVLNAKKEVINNLLNKYPLASKYYFSYLNIRKTFDVNNLSESEITRLFDKKDSFESREIIELKLEQDKQIVLELIQQYPEAAKYYYKTFCKSTKSCILPSDINSRGIINKLFDLRESFPEENERQIRLAKAKKKEEEDRNVVLYYVRQYPEATRYYFNLHWGISKDLITEADVTSDKISVLLSYRNNYEQEYRRQLRGARTVVLDLIAKYPIATRHFFKLHWGLNKRVIKEEHITDEVVSVLYFYKDTYELEEKRLIELSETKRMLTSLIKKYPHAARFYFKKHWNISKPLISSADVSEDKIPILLRYKDNFSLDNFIIAKQEEKREIVLDLVSKYPYASRFYFKKHWSITKSHINDTDITDDKIETLLSYQNSYADEDIKQKRIEDKSFVLNLVHKYPEATKYYFKFHWGLIKTHVADYDITDDKIDTLLSHRYTYEDEERRQVNIAKEIKKKAEEARILANLHSCVSSWGSHSNSNIKHKYFFSYYPYHIYKDNTSSSMRDTWRTVWNFKNDPDKNVSAYEHQSALETVTDLVENTLRSAFGSKTEYLTLVCLTASTQRKTELRYKDFAEQVCKDLNMHNAYPHIQVIEGGSAKHDGGDGSRRVSYDRYFFNGKYIVLFDDVRTTGHSLEQERRTMEELGAKVICAVTIAQTAY